MKIYINKALLFLFVSFFGLTGCKYYTRDILFKTSRHELDSLRKNQVKYYEKNYLVRVNDQIEFQLFTNKGEIIIDPTSEFAKQASASGASTTSGSSNRIRYTVQYDGKINLPLIGKLKVDSLTTHELDSFLAVKFSAYYQEPFVISKVVSRKIYILSLGQGAGGLGGMSGGAGGGSGAVKEYTVERENLNLLEVLTASGSVGPHSKVNKIKIIRGNINNPKITIVDLSSLSKTIKSDLRVYPNDIIYIEPGRRPVLDLFRELSLVSQFVFAATSFYFIYTQISK